MSNKYDFVNYLLHMSRSNFYMPPIIIAPSLTPNPSSIGCDSNSLSSGVQVDQPLRALGTNSGSFFSVSNKLNADSGSSGK